MSAIVHIFSFFVFAMVKFHDEAALNAAKMSVTFVKPQDAKILKRSFEIRSTPSIDSQKPLPADIGQKAETRVNYKATSDFYVDNSPRVFSQVKSVGQKAMDIGIMQKPSFNIVRGNALE